MKYNQKAGLLRMFYCVLILLCFNNTAALSQQTEDENIFSTEKISFMMGIGLDYGLFGFRGKYKFHDHFKVIANFGIHADNLLWNIGFETNSNPLLSNCVLPYFTAFYGVNANLTLTTYNGIQEFRIIEGFTLGTGVHILFSQKSVNYVSIGFNYRLLSPEIDRTIDSFNKTYDTYESRNYSHITPSFGIALRIWE